MLQNLSNQQVEKALAWIYDPLPKPIPKELRHLQQMEWFLLSRMLESLLQEQEDSPLQ